ncbi:MAG: Fe-S cluster assembly protein SufD [Polyangiaceae bacterium]|nr:Fe-S cluster assembly protein SufD [Polyangiaceae bacterium]
MTELSLQKGALLAESLAHFEPISGPLAELRQAGQAQLKQHGLPGPRDEAWRFTQVRSVTDVAFRREPAGVAARAVQLQVSDTATLVFGSDLASAKPGPGIEVWSSRTGGEPPPWTKIALSSQTPIAPFAALNGSEAEELWCIRLSGSPGPLQIIYPGPTSSGEPTMKNPRVHVRVEEGTRATFVELTTASESLAPTLTNSVSEVFVGKNATLEHVRISLGNLKSRQISTVSAKLLRNSSYLSRVVTLGGALTRTDLTISMSEKGAQAELDGLYFAADGEQVDHHTVVEHAQGHCQSVQKYKGFASGNGQAIFDGIVRVHPGASGTVAHQSNRNVLLSEEAVVHTKPHLEIENDDVVCTHGATVGRLRLEEQFYLQSRGIDPDTARTLLSYAFASEVFDAIIHPAARDFVRREFLSKLGSPALFAELLAP